MISWDGGAILPKESVAWGGESEIHPLPVYASGFDLRVWGIEKETDSVVCCQGRYGLSESEHSQAPPFRIN